MLVRMGNIRGMPGERACGRPSALVSGPSVFDRLHCQNFVRAGVRSLTTSTGESSTTVTASIEEMLDTSTGRLTRNVLGSVADFERTLMLERQREGAADSAKGSDLDHRI